MGVEAKGHAFNAHDEILRRRAGVAPEKGHAAGKMT
jgi:hypothetical protein